MTLTDPLGYIGFDRGGRGQTAAVAAPKPPRSAGRTPVVAGFLPFEVPSRPTRCDTFRRTADGSPGFVGEGADAWHRQCLLAGAFDGSLAEAAAGTRPIPLLFDHSGEKKVTDTADPDFRLWATPAGLRFAARGPVAAEILAQPRRQVSFAAAGKIVGESRGADGVPVRFFGPGSRLFEVSVVAAGNVPGAVVFEPNLAGFVAAHGGDLWTMPTDPACSWSRAFVAAGHALPPDLWG